MSIKKRNKGWKEEEGEECDSWSFLDCNIRNRLFAFLFIVQIPRSHSGCSDTWRRFVTFAPSLRWKVRLRAGEACLSESRRERPICKRSSWDKLVKEKGCLSSTDLCRKIHSHKTVGKVVPFVRWKFLKPHWRYDLCFGDVEYFGVGCRGLTASLYEDDN